MAARRLALTRSLLGQFPQTLPPMTAVIIGVSFWCAGYSLQLASSDPFTMMRLHQLGYTGVAFAPVSAMLLSVTLAFRVRIPPGAWVAAMTIPIISTCLTWSNSYHGLIWKSYEIIPVGMLSTLKLVGGPWFWFQTYLSYGCIVVAIALIGIRSRQAWSTSPRESLALISAVGLPWLLNSIYLFTSLSSIDLSPLAGIAGIAILFNVVGRDRIRGLVPMVSGALFERTGDAMVLLNHAGEVIHANQAGARLFEQSVELTIGASLSELWPGFDFDAGCSGHHEDFHRADPDTELNQVFDIRVYPGRATPESSTVHIVSLRDITERREAEEAAARAALYDQPTGLPDRQFFRETLTKTVERASAEDRPLSLFILDIDDLKTINDLYSQSVGDEIICAVANAIMNPYGGRNADFTTFPGRLGGDEFALLVDGMSQAEELEKIATDIQRQVAACGNYEFVPSVSIGISTYPASASDPSSLLRQADLACQAAQAEGPATHHLFNVNMEMEINRRAAVSRELWKAVRAGDFTLVFQPKVDLNTSRVIGFEALIRWTSEELGFVSPEEFIAIAEQNGSIHGIGKWVLARSCTLLAEWKAAGLGDVRVAVNVSALELREPRYAEYVFTCLQENSLDPSALELELTERSLLGEDVEMISALRDLKAAGIHISLDDFGTGYATLACLSRIDLDTIKMDRSLIIDIDLDGRATSIAASVIALARMLSMNVVAEGIETEEQVQMLRDLRCHQAQGYFFSRPVPPEEVPLLLRSKLPIEKPLDS